MSPARARNADGGTADLQSWSRSRLHPCEQSIKLTRRGICSLEMTALSTSGAQAGRILATVRCITIPRKELCLRYISARCVCKRRAHVCQRDILCRITLTPVGGSFQEGILEAGRIKTTCAQHCSTLATATKHVAAHSASFYTRTAQRKHALAAEMPPSSPSSPSSLSTSERRGRSSNRLE